MDEFLTKWRVGLNQDMNTGLILLGGQDRVLSLVKDGDSISFTEECDGHYTITMSKADAAQALLEALAWIYIKEN